MDAHLLQKFFQAAEPVLAGARLEKIQEAANGHLILMLHGAAQKKSLCFRFGRKEPFCFLTDARIAAAPKPTAQIMRLRKYFGGRRIAAVVSQPWSRKLWLMAVAGENTPQGKTGWLCLDLVNGPSLHFLGPEEVPQPEAVSWPGREKLKDALGNWREWPVLTPLLRKTLALLPEPEQWALMADLEDGGGDVFLYRDQEGNIAKISPWPLPAELHANLKEEAEADVVSAIKQAGQSLVLTALFKQKTAQMLAPGQRRMRQIHKLLEKLNQDEKRLNAMLACQTDAEAIRANLWQLNSGEKTDSLTLPTESGPKEIALRPAQTIAENMERLFHQSARGKRGLAMLKQRQADLQNELTALEMRQNAKPVGPVLESSSQEGITSQHANIKKEEIKNNAGRDLAAIKASARILPKNVAGFRSSDGYMLLRGKDAKGNIAVRRLAAGHDLWAHVEQGQGAHVVIRVPHAGHAVPARTLEEAGTLAANKSWLCAAANASIMYAEVRHVKNLRGAQAGKVTIDKLRETRTVPVDASLEEKLKPL